MSDPAPEILEVFRNHKVFSASEAGRMVWDWMFLENGRKVVVTFVPAHGSDVGDYELYDVKTARLLSIVSGDDDNAPEGVKRLEDHKPEQ